MGKYYKEVKWNSDFEYLKNFSLELLNTQIVEDIDFGKIINDVDNQIKDNRIHYIKEKYHLHNHFYYLISTPQKRTHDPHIHTEENTSISLNIPIKGCDENTVTSWIEPIGNIHYATDNRTSSVLHQSQEYKIIEQNALVMPRFVRNDVFHMITSNHKVTERINLAWPLLSKYKKLEDLNLCQIFA